MGFFEDLFGKRSASEVRIPPPGATEELQTNLLGQLSQMLFNFLGREPTDQELQASLEPIFALAARRGGEDIQQRGIELAGARGLNLSDTPIAAPLLRQQRELTEGLQAQRANTLLGLKQQAIQNRFQLGQLFNQGIGTLGGIRAQNRMSTSLTTPSPFENITSLLGGGLSLGSGLGQILNPAGAAAAGGTAGAAAGGLSGLGSLFGLSSRDYKTDIAPLSRTDESLATEVIRETPLYTWSYKPGLGFKDAARHLGPVTEEVPALLKTEDGKKLDIINTIGLGLAAIKNVDTRLRKIEENRDGP